MNELTDRGISCLYICLRLPLIQAGFAPGFYGQEGATELADFILSCEFLLIDDLGSEKQTGARYGELLEILNTRAMRGRTSLCKNGSHYKSYACKFIFLLWRTCGRILGAYDIFKKFAGEDIRLKTEKCFIED